MRQRRKGRNAASCIIDDIGSHSRWEIVYDPTIAQDYLLGNLLAHPLLTSIKNISLSLASSTEDLEGIRNDAEEGALGSSEEGQATLHSEKLHC